MGFLPSDVESNENLSFEILEVFEAESLALDVFDELVGSLQFGVRIRQLKRIDHVRFILFKGLEYLFESRIDSVEIVLNQAKELL